MEEEDIEVVVVRPSSANARTLARVIGAPVHMVGFSPHSSKPVFRIVGGKDVFKKLRADNIIVKKCKFKQ